MSTLDRLGEDVSGACGVFAENMGVDAQGYGGVDEAVAGGDYVDRDSGQQTGRVQVVQPGVRQRRWRALSFTGYS